MAGSTNVVEVSMMQKQEGQVVINVLHYRQDPVDAVPFTAAMFPTFAALLKAAWAAGPQVVQSSSLSLGTIRVDELGPSVANLPPRPPGFDFPVVNRLDYTAGLPVAGAAAGDYLPTFNTVTFQKKSGQVGRRKNGSIHYAGVIEADTLGNTLTVAAIPFWLLAGGPILTTSIAVTVGVDTFKMLPCVLSRRGMQQSLFNPGQLPTAWTYLTTSAPLRVLVGSMRSRKA